MPRRQTLLSAASYGASMVAGNLTYRSVKALGGSDFAGKISASAVGTAIGLGEAALLKRPAAFISLLANAIGAGFGASEAAKAMAKKKERTTCVTSPLLSRMGAGFLSFLSAKRG
jgi:hypothetical protein